MKTSKILILAAVTSLSNVGGRSETLDITTSEGRTYHHAEVVRSDPDGIIINYEPATQGIGMAKLKFANLPETWRTQFGYDPEKSAAFEKDPAQANARWHARRSAMDEAVARYRNIAELNRSLAGDSVTSYSVSLSADGKITAQGFTGSYTPYSEFCPWQSYPGQIPSFGPNLSAGTSTNLNRPSGNESNGMSLEEK